MGAANGVERSAAKAKFLADLEATREAMPNNLMAKHLSAEYFNSLSEEEQVVLFRCCKTGVDNQDSSVGCYAMQPADYDKYNAFFDKVIREYHGDKTGNKKHVTNWDAKDVGDHGVLDVTKLGLQELSMRVRVGRNLKKFNLPGMMLSLIHI